jgi:hypothetical protein
MVHHQCPSLARLPTGGPTVTDPEHPPVPDQSGAPLVPEEQLSWTDMAAGPMASYDAEGHPLRHMLLVMGAALLAAVAIGWFLWTAMDHANPPASATLVGYTVTGDDEVRIRYEVTRDPATTVTCTLEAQDRYHDPVGRVSITVPAGGDATVARSDAVRTTARAVTGIVVGCAPATGS